MIDSFHVTEILKPHLAKLLVDSFHHFCWLYECVYGTFDIEQYNNVIQSLFRCNSNYDGSRQKHFKNVPEQQLLGPVS
jgi:hypothetical protein